MAQGQSYKDPLYDEIESRLEREYGLPLGGMRAIRTKGERSNADQVSLAEAKSVYQIIPSTRDAFLKKYGVDAYGGPRQAARVAALHLRDGLERTGNWEGAVRDYIGGPDTSKHGKVTDAYVRRVTGRPQANPGNPGQVETRGTTARFNPRTRDEILAMAKANREGAGIVPADTTRKPLDIKPITPADIAPKPTGAGIIMGSAPTPGMGGGATLDPTNAPSRAAMETQAAVTATKAATAPTFGERVDAAVEENFITNMIRRGIDDKLAPRDPEWAKTRSAQWQKLEAYAETPDELELLRSPEAYNSREDFNQILGQIDATRKRRATIGGGASGLALNLVTAVADPVGLLLTGGVGKVAQIGRVGFKAATVAGAAGKSGLLGSVVEGVAANVAFTAAMDVSGDQPMHVDDYLWAGAIGVGIGATLHGVSRVASGALDRSDNATLQAVADATAAEQKSIRSAAVARVGTEASEAEVQQAMNVEALSRGERIMRAALGEKSDTDVFLPLDPESARVMGSKKTADAAAVDHGLDGIPDNAERAMSAEIQVRSVAIRDTAMVDGVLDKGLEGRFLKAFNGESDAIAMLRSTSPVLQAAAIQLLESTTGAGGRKSSAAITKVMLERGYMRHMLEYDNAFEAWRVANGHGKFTTMMGHEVRAQYDRALFREIEARGDDIARVTSDDFVSRGADAWEQGMQSMADHMRRAKTLGHERLPLNSKGYMRHMLDGGMVHNLTKTQRKNVEGIIARQFQKLNEYSYTIKKAGSKRGEPSETITKKFDAKFSRELAKRYLDEAVGRVRGSRYVPVNITHPDASEILTDALRNMQGLAPEDRTALLEKYSRGGQSFTKGRLKLELDADIGDGMQLGDLFNQDIMGMYRSYARKVSGDVALARYGIFGKKGLQMMRDVASKTGATRRELEAFERVTAEFINEPWAGAKDYQWAKNLSAITSAVRLGGMVFTQAGELGNAVNAIGIRATLSSIPEMGRVWKELGRWRKGGQAENPILNDLDEIYGVIGGDGYNQTRLFDAPDQNVDLFDQESLGRFSKFARASSHFTMVASGFRALHAVQVRGLSENIVKKAVRYMKNGEADKALADMGISPEMTKAFRAEMDAGRLATFDGKGRLTKLDMLGSKLDPSVIHDFAQVVERGAGQIIQKTFIGETGAWAHDDFLKLLFKFRTFGITSIEKQFGRQMAIGGGGMGGAIRIASVYAGAMSFAVPIYLARLQAQSLGMSRTEREEFFEKRATVAGMASATSKYLSIMGLAPDVADILTTFGASAGIIPEDALVGVGARGNQSGGLGGLNPAFGVAEDMSQGILGADPMKVLKTLPGFNLPQVTPIVNGISASNE